MKYLITAIATVLLVGCGNLEADRELFDAVSDGNIENVKKHIDAGANVNAKDNGGNTPIHLHLHPYHGNAPDKAIVKILLENGADINAKTENGFTPLDFAILIERRKKLNNEISDLLRSQGAKSGAETSLVVAASLGDVQSIEKLLKAGADINETLLHLTASSGYKNATELLLARGANINATNDQGRTPLFEAVRSRKKDIVELLIANGADISTDTGLHRLAVAYAYSDWSKEEQKQEKRRRSESIEIAKLLISKGVDVNRKNHGDNALHIAAQSGHKEMAELLIEAGVNIDESNNGSQTPLHKAAFEGRDEIVNMLIQNGAKVNPVIQSTGSFNGMTPVDFAIRQNELKTVALFRIHGGMTGEELKVFFKPVVENASQEPSETKASNNLMLNAVRNGNIKNVEKQLTAGADVKAVLENGMTALHVAAIFGHIEIVELLIANGTDVNATDNKFGATSLYGAAGAGQKDIAELLISNGAIVNAKIPRGDTALHAAIMFGHKEVIELLITNDADVNAKVIFGIAKGMTPLDIANLTANPNKSIEVADLLRKHGGKTAEELKAEGK